jgi:hypothetical protein
MLSYILYGIDKSEAERRLDARLPEQSDPWVLFDDERNPIAYLNIYDLDDVGRDDDDPPVPEGSVVQADLSGRHAPDRLVELMIALQGELGGIVRDDDDEPVWADSSDATP